MNSVISEQDQRQFSAEKRINILDDKVINATTMIVLGGIDGNGAAQSRFKIADIAFGGGFGQLVQPLGTGFEGG